MISLRILVTGSSGLIGSATCSMLQEKGFRIVTMDNRVNPSTNIVPNFGNLIDSEELSKAVKNVDGIVHLGAVSRVIDAQKNPLSCYLTNVEALKNLIYLIKKQSQLPWVIFASSREVYGKPEYIPVSEKHPLNPINVYGKCKKLGEELLKNQKDFPVIIFRFSNVYGSPFDYQTRVIPAFLWGAISKNPIRLDSPNHVFDFTYLSDVVGAITVAVNKLVSKEHEGCQIFNLSPEKGTSLSQLVNLLEDNR